MLIFDKRASYNIFSFALPFPVVVLASRPVCLKSRYVHSASDALMLVLSEFRAIVLCFGGHFTVSTGGTELTAGLHHRQCYFVCGYQTKLKQTDKVSAHQKGS
jgi:hypothetical protein